MVKAGCDELGSHVGHLVVGIDFAQRGVRRCVVGEEVEDNPAKSFAWAKIRVGSGAVANLFAMDSILLVIEGEHGRFDPCNIIQVMQRHRRGMVDVAINGETDVA